MWVSCLKKGGRHTSGTDPAWTPAESSVVSLSGFSITAFLFIPSVFGWRQEGREMAFRGINRVGEDWKKINDNGGSKYFSVLLLNSERRWIKGALKVSSFHSGLLFNSSFIQGLMQMKPPPCTSVISTASRRSAAFPNISTRSCCILMETGWADVQSGRANCALCNSENKPSDQQRSKGFRGGWALFKRWRPRWNKRDGRIFRILLPLTPKRLCVCSDRVLIYWKLPWEESEVKSDHSVWARISFYTFEQRPLTNQSSALRSF